MSKLPLFGNYQLVIWDWNGCLRDDMHAIYKSGVQRIFSHFNVPCPTLDQYRDQVTGDSMSSFYWPNGIPKEATTADLNAIMAEGFKQDGSPPAFPDALSTVQELNRQGIRQVLVTAYDEKKIGADVTRLGFEGLFEQTIGGVTNKAKIFADIVAQRGLDRRSVCAIGDQVEDAVAARDADLDAYLCCRGFHTPERIIRETGHMPNVRVLWNLSALVDNP